MSMETKQCIKWKDRILQEFADQGAHEKLLGLPVTPFMVGLEDPLVQLRCQIGFINFVVTPYYEALKSSFFMEVAVENVRTNKAYYAEQLKYLETGLEEDKAKCTLPRRTGEGQDGEPASPILPYPREGQEFDFWNVDVWTHEQNDGKAVSPKASKTT